MILRERLGLSILSLLVLSAAGPVDIVNLRLVAGYRLGEDRLVLVIPEEGTDLNDDGDGSDNVLHVVDLKTGTATNLGLAGGIGERAIEGGRMAFVVSERSQGRADLNGDLDFDDSVLHLHDFDSGVTTNLEVEISSEPMFGEAALLFFVRESAQGNTDLNGDGDALDVVLHVLDLTSGVITNVGLPAFQGVRFQGEQLAFPIFEAGHGNVDLNADGDTEDLVMHIFDVRTGTSRNLMLESPALPYKWSEENLAFLVFEASQGDGDLNGDGDAHDYVMHLYDAGTSSTRNLEIAASILYWLDFGNHLLLWSVGERDQGETDLNGDGDLIDFVLHVHDVGTGSSVNTGLAGFGLRVVQDVALLSAEEGPIDFNDDGDVDDFVLHFFDGSTGNVENTTLAGHVEPIPPWLYGHERFAAFRADEWSGGTDLNGDGDITDQVLHLFDATTKSLSNLGLPARPGAGVKDEHVIFLVSEAAHGGRDLNRDGDAADEVLHLFDTKTGVIRNLGLATTQHGSIDGRWLAFHVDEELQGGIDLNGDGDADDRVTHLADLWSTPERRLLVLVDEVDAHVASGELGLSQAQFLEAFLNGALSGIQQGSDPLGAYYVWFFALFVALYVVFGVLTPESAETLIHLATVIIQQLTS